MSNNNNIPNSPSLSASSSSSIISAVGDGGNVTLAGGTTNITSAIIHDYNGSTIGGAPGRKSTMDFGFSGGFGDDYLTSSYYEVYNLLSSSPLFFLLAPLVTFVLCSGELTSMPGRSSSRRRTPTHPPRWTSAGVRSATIARSTNHGNSTTRHSIPKRTRRFPFWIMRPRRPRWCCSIRLRTRWLWRTTTTR